MKAIKIYDITRKQFEATEYRPLGVEIDEIETEDEWNYGDVIENEGEYEVEVAADCRDLIVWKIHTPTWQIEEGLVDEEDYEEYFTVELKTQS